MEHYGKQQASKPACYQLALFFLVDSEDDVEINRISNKAYIVTLVLTSFLLLKSIVQHRQYCILQKELGSSIRHQAGWHD